MPGRGDARRRYARPVSDEIPTGRVRRTAKVSSALGGSGARVAGTMGANLVRSRDRRAAALERRHLEAAETLVTALGTMKGAAMKVGQMASFIEVDFLPEEHRALYQERLAALRTSAPPLPFDQVERVLRREWGEPVERVLADLEPEAAAAASVGQVHRGTLPDGRAVAVKVQYPGVEEAIRADLQNAAVLVRLAKLLAPRLDARAVAAEIRERIMEELDYELEAQSQRRFARGYRGHPFVHVPDVMTDLSRRRVLVTEWAEGKPFPEVLGLGDEERSRFGETLYRFYFGAMHHLGVYNADPHPGNYLLRDDGRTTILDFGSVKEVEPPYVERVADMFAAAVAGDAERVRDVLAEWGFLPRPGRVDADRVLSNMMVANGWYLQDREVRVDAALVREAIAASTDPRAGYYDLIRNVSLPPDDVMGQRLDRSILAVLGQLGAQRNWWRIASEYWYGAEPATELGVAEKDFWTSAGRSRSRHFAAAGSAR